MCSNEHCYVLQDMKQLFTTATVKEDDEDTIVVCCRKYEARAYAMEKLSQLPGEEQIYFGVDQHGTSKWVNTRDNEDDDWEEAEDDKAAAYYDEKGWRKNLFGSMPVPAVLRLRKGAKVLCKKNLQDGVVNGSVGEVIGFTGVSVSNSLVAARQLGFDVGVGEVKKSWHSVNDGRRWPIVQFQVQGRAVAKTVVPASNSIEDSEGVQLCSRVQLPLLLCYALTVDCAQLSRHDTEQNDLQVQQNLVLRSAI